MKKILLITTGGTIASIKTKDGLHPGPGTKILTIMYTS
jgi:L-asparaginase/Glu-tRNA(Gln) amidotransferase subunit D